MTKMKQWLRKFLARRPFTSIDTIKCDVCQFLGGPSDFPVVNEQFTCPRCKVDESGLIVGWV